MPQEFQILRCCDCEKFQVHHVKKANKWQCKVCGLKQSMKRAFFIGSSRDCRVNVQKLNFQAGEQEMKRKLGESCSSLEDKNPSLEAGGEDFDFATENKVDANYGIDETDWVDNNDGMDENDWVDENDWIDEDGIDESPSGILDISCNRNSLSDLEDEFPSKKQRSESYLESGAVGGTSDFIYSNEDFKNQGGFSFLSVLKCRQNGNSTTPIDSANNISSTDVPKAENKQVCDSFKNREKIASPGIAKSKSNSRLKPSQGFQIILNEAKKQRTDFNYDLDL